MSDTPDTDAKSFIAFDTEGRKLVVVLATTSESFERERDEARKHLRDANRGAEINAHINQKYAQQIIDARDENTKLRDIADRAIWRMANGVCLPDVSAIRTIKEEGLRLRAELKQLMEGGK